MANVYVDSNAAGAGTGADWTNAYTTLAAAMTAKAAGDIFFVAHNHNATQASAKTITSPGTTVSPCQVYCVSSAGTVPPVSADLRTTAIEATTAASNILLVGVVSQCYGIEFSAGGGGANAAMIRLGATTSRWSLERCKLTIASTVASQSGAIAVGGSGTIAQDYYFKWVNTKVKFGHSAQRITPFGPCNFIWQDTATAVDTAVATPATLFDTNGANGGVVIGDVRGVDLVAITGALLPAWAIGHIRFTDCKLGSGVSICSTPTGLNCNIEIVRSDSGNTNYRTERYRYQGTQTAETTIVRTGGASDGTTPLAWKLVTNANAKPALPFESMPITAWQETVGGALTATVYGVWGGGAVPNNNDIWMEVEYLGTSGFPVSSFVSSGLTDGLATAAAVASDSSTWGGSTTKFKLVSPSFTPVIKGPVIIRIYAGAASSTFYIDPKAVIA